MALMYYNQILLLWQNIVFGLLTFTSLLEKLLLHNSQKKSFSHKDGKASEPENFIAKLGNYDQAVKKYLHFSTN
jgi:hypothetical protein